MPVEQTNSEIEMTMTIDLSVSVSVSDIDMTVAVSGSTPRIKLNKFEASLDSTQSGAVTVSGVQLLNGINIFGR